MNHIPGGLTKGILSRELICETALEVIDGIGLEGLSMRALANRLGVKASSLYYHFSSKDELLTGVGEFLYRELGQSPDGEDWAEQLRRTFVQLREFVDEHPNAAPLLVHDLARSPVARQRAQELLELLCDAGMDPASSVSLLSNLVALLIGQSLLGLSGREERFPHWPTIPGDGDGDGDGDGGDPATAAERRFSPDANEPLDQLPLAAWVSNAAGVEVPAPRSVFVAGVDALIDAYSRALEPQL